MGTANANNTINVDSDFPLGGAALAAGYIGAATQLANAQTTSATTWANAYEAANEFSWGQQLLLPAIQAAANLLILEWQKRQYDDIEARRVGYVDAAVEEYCACMHALMADIKEAADEVPEPAHYQPFSPSGEQCDTVRDNLAAVPRTQEYVLTLNQNSQEADLARAVMLNPKYYQMNEITWCSIESLIKGELPIGLTVETLTRSAEDSVSNGRLGRACGNFRRNLGLVDYRVQRAGREEQRLERASQNQDISSLEKQGDIRDMMVKPEQRFGFALQQAQLIQNSMQNANNAYARKAPFLMQQVQVKLQKCTQQMQLLAGKAGLVNGYVPNYAAVLNTQIRDLSQGIVNGIGSINGNGGGFIGGAGGGSNLGGTGAGAPFGGAGGGLFGNVFG